MRKKSSTTTRLSPTRARIVQAVKENPGKRIAELIRMVYWSPSRGGTRYTTFRRAIKSGSVRAVTRSQATYLYPARQAGSIAREK